MLDSYSRLWEPIDGHVLLVPKKAELSHQFEIIWNVYQALLDIYNEDAKREWTVKIDPAREEFTNDNSSLSHYTPFSSTFQQHRIVALGGTFDRLHYGHKVLLSLGCLLATDELVVGVTADQMAQKKIRADKLEPITERILRLKRFFAEIEFEKYKIVELTDAFGPTVSDAAIGGLVVTEETQEGAHLSIYWWLILTCS